MEPLRKELDAEIVTKGEDGKPGPVVITATTGDEDRDGDVLDPKGWDLADYERNPVVLWAHDAKSLPIGMAEKIKANSKGISIQVKFASHERAREVEAAVREGVVRGVSVGFRPTVMPELRPGGGLKFTGQKLLEVSLVPVPSNASALVQSKSARDEICKALETLSPAAESRPMPEAPARTEEAEKMDPVAENKGAAQPATVTMTQEQLDAAIAKAATAAVEQTLRTTTKDPSAEIVGKAAEKGAERENKAPAISKWSMRRKAAEILPGQDKGIGMARVAMAFALSKMNPGMLPEEGAKELGYMDVADAMDSERSARKALGVSSISAGAAFVPETFADTFIDELHPVAVVRGLIPTEGVVKLTRGESFSIPEVTSRPTSYMLGEASAPANSTPVTGLRNVDLKWMATEVVIGKDWLSGSIANADQIVRMLMLRSAALKEDLQLIEGKGAENEVRGLKLWAGNNVQATATPDLDKAETDLDKLVGYLEDSDVPLDGNVAYLGHPIHFRGLASYKNANAIKPLREEMRKEKTLNGYKFAKSSQFNKTAANSCFYIGNFAHAMLVDGMAMEIEEDNQYVTSGTTHSASARRQIVLRLWRRLGFGVKHANAFAYLHTCTWGA